MGAHGGIAAARRFWGGEGIENRGPSAERTAHHQGCVERLPAHDGGVNGFEKRSHRVVFRHEQKVDGAVQAGNVTVDRDSETEDDFAHERRTVYSAGGSVEKRFLKTAFCGRCRPSYGRARDSAGFYEIQMASSSSSSICFCERSA